MTDRLEHDTPCRDASTITQRRGIGYAGALGERAYLAQILGTDPRYEFHRVFLPATRIQRDHWNRTRYMLTLTYQVGPGLYEEQSEGDRRYLLVWDVDGDVRWKTIAGERADAIARQLDAGVAFDDARRATKPISSEAHL